MMPKTRVEAFTDAVIAIILTLLILELKFQKADWVNWIRLAIHKLCMA